MRELTYEEALKVDGQGGAAAAFLEGAGAGSIRRRSRLWCCGLCCWGTDWWWHLFCAVFPLNG